MLVSQTGAAPGLSLSVFLPHLQPAQPQHQGNSEKWRPGKGRDTGAGCGQIKMPESVATLPASTCDAQVRTQSRPIDACPLRRRGQDGTEGLRRFNPTPLKTSSPEPSCPASPAVNPTLPRGHSLRSPGSAPLQRLRLGGTWPARGPLPSTHLHHVFPD